jgi:hypothetical protein
MEYVHVMSLFQRGSVRIAAATNPEKRRVLLRGACHDAESIERGAAGWGLPLASLLRAGVASAGGDRDSTLFYLRSAESGFRAHDMGLFAATARIRIGNLIGGEAGKTTLENASTWMEAQGIRNPARMTAMLSPGYDR